MSDHRPDGVLADGSQDAQERNEGLRSGQCNMWTQRVRDELTSRIVGLVSVLSPPPPSSSSPLFLPVSFIKSQYWAFGASRRPPRTNFARSGRCAHEDVLVCAIGRVEKARLDAVEVSIAFEDGACPIVEFGHRDEGLARLHRLGELRWNRNLLQRGRGGTARPQWATGSEHTSDKHLSETEQMEMHSSSRS